MSEQTAGSRAFLAGFSKPAQNKPQLTAISQGHIFLGMALCLFCIEIGTFIATPHAKSEGAITNLFVCFMLLINILASQFSWNKTGTVLFRLASYLVILVVFVRLYFVIRG